MEPYWQWITLVVLIIGTFGTVLPVLPGLPLMAITVGAYAWGEGFQQITWGYLAVIVFLALLGFLLDYILGTLTIKKMGASKAGIWGFILGGIGGIFLMGPVGLLVGPILGVFCGEILFGKNIKEAAKIGVGSLIGNVLAAIVKMIFAVCIILMFIFRVML